MVVYLVEDCETAPGRVLTVFAEVEDAEAFAESLGIRYEITEREVYYGQPPKRYYNK